MKTIYINELKTGQLIVSETFAIQEAKRAEDRNKQVYYDLVIADKTGRMKAKIWPDQLNSIDKALLKVGRIIAVSGKVDDFRGVLQMSITDVKDVDETKLDEYLESSIMPTDVLWQELEFYTNQVKADDVKQLIQSLLADEEVARNLRYLPAGIYIHHGFRSGLLQHTLEMLRICFSIKDFYPDIDYDVVIAGVILHDLGKMHEFFQDGAAINFSLSGNMVGHLVMSLEILNKFVAAEFNPTKLLKLKNVILGSHGKKEFGSPVLPISIEAMMVSLADEMSYKVAAFQRIRKDNKSAESNFSDFDNILGTRVYLDRPE